MDKDKKYRDFGTQLKKIRQDAKKSVNDVSGAVEISAEKLKQLELGQVRPEEDIVAILANYFELSKRKTQQLLALAGYGSLKKKSKNAPISDFQMFLEQMLGSKMANGGQGVILAISEEMKNDRMAVYTDETSLNISERGVIIEFLQNARLNNKTVSRSVAKVGMSLKHAYRLRDILQRTLAELDSKDQPTS
ncbi:MAG: helix-turn-helix domain-containing protein [Candidatus Saccharibacteria bacterium]|nr:helix-turn-helix domain-containing protein [Candidatus Saccharibacteria bacterium]MCY4088564.1 helix-turn-helix domain-containing protein [Candidatus Saccharibacteria bacterium]